MSGERSAVEALAELVALKDGPRGADYERRKPAAWQAARDALTALAEDQARAGQGSETGTTVTEWGVRWDDVTGTSKTLGSVESSWTGHDGWSTGPYDEAECRRIAGAAQTVVTREHTTYPDRVTEWHEATS